MPTMAIGASFSVSKLPLLMSLVPLAPRVPLPTGPPNLYLGASESECTGELSWLAPLIGTADGAIAVVDYIQVTIGV